MKKFITIISISLICQITTLAEYKITATAKPYYLKKGESGKVLINIELFKGSYIKPAPPLIIRCLPLEGVSFPKEIFKSTEMNISINQKKDISLLDVKDGIEIPFMVDTKARRGIYELKFEIKFLVCSESNSICSKAVETVNVKIYVTRKSLKK